MKRITVELLESINACPDQVETFSKLFPKGAPVSMRSLAKAQRAGLDVFFLENLLTGLALAEYEKVRGPAWAEYEKIRDQAWAEYEKIRARAWAEYDKITAPAWAEYDKVTAPAWAEYKKVIGTALVKALLESE